MPTTNPVPSTDPTDLLFNAGKLDEVVNGTANSFTDRLGVARRTVAGMNADFDAQLADAESDLNVYRADAAASAAEALGYLQTIRATSYGAYASDPATDPLGNPPTVGDEYFNTTSNLLKRWNGTTWQASDINTANLAAPSGSSLVGYDGGTVQDVLDAVTGPTGAGSVGYMPAGTGAVATTVQAKQRKIVHVTDFTGVDPTGVTNSLSGLQAAADYCKTSGYKLEGVPGNYLIDDTWVIECDADLSTMTVKASATTVPVAVRVGPNTAGQYLFDADIKLPFVINTAKTSPGWAGFENSIGVEIANAYQCRITVPSVYDFGIGLKEGGYSVGCVYNTITIGVLFGNKINQQLKSGNPTGWVNQNTHIGGRFAYLNTEGTTVSGVLHIQCRTFDAATNNPPDTNVWINPSIEGNEPQYHLDIQGRFNTIISPRLETFSPILPKINWHSDSASQTAGNMIVGGYINGDVTYSYSGVGTAGNNQLVSNRASGVMDFSGAGYNTRNTSGDNVSYPHFQGFPSGVAPLGKTNGATDWTYRVFGQGFAIKQTGDAYARVLIGSPGYIFFGSGAAAPTAGMRYNADPAALAITTDTHFAPDADNTLSLGRAGRRWSVVYAGTGTINTSDERAKQDISALDDAEKRVAVVLKGMIKKYRFKDAVVEKGDAARIHVGVIAQEVMRAFQSEGLNPMRYGIVCRDEWSDADGMQHDRYGVRYEELLAFIIAAL